MGSFAFLAGASAQGVPVPSPLDFSGTVQGPQAQQGPPTGTSVLSALPQAPLPDVPILQLGPVKFYPHLLYRFLYGEGIPGPANEKLTTAINEVYPGILFQLGNHWQLDYTPSVHFYSNNNFRDTTDQLVSLNGGTTYENWTLGLLQRYADLTQPLIETAAQTEVESYNTAIRAAYQFNAKASLEMGLSQDFAFEGQNAALEPLVNYKVWSTMDWLDYQIWPRFGAALGVGAGYVDLSAGADMFFEQLQARLIWQATDKLSLLVTGGLDDRQFRDSTQPDLVNPIFTVTGAYKPFEHTLLSLNASRVVNPSYLQGLISESTTVSGSFHQELFKKLRLDFSTGYSVVSYEASATAIPNETRVDHYTLVNARLSVPFLKRGTAGVFYQALKNTSTVSTYQISSTQFGLDLSYHF